MKKKIDPDKELEIITKFFKSGGIIYEMPFNDDYSNYHSEKQIILNGNDKYSKDIEDKRLYSENEEKSSYPKSGEREKFDDLDKKLNDLA